MCLKNFFRANSKLREHEQEIITYEDVKNFAEKLDSKVLEQNKPQKSHSRKRERNLVIDSLQDQEKNPSQKQRKK